MFGISLKQVAVTIVMFVIAMFIYDFISSKIGNYEEEQI